MSLAAAGTESLQDAAQALAENRLRDAEHILRPHLALRPDDVLALRMLASIAARLGLFGQSESLLRRALETAPGYTDALLDLAQSLIQQARPTEAIAALDAILGSDPDHFQAAINKAIIFGQLGRYEEALTLYERLVSTAGVDPLAWLGYGHLLKTIGRAGESAAAFRKAIDLRPQFGEAWWSLANLKTDQFSDKDVETMERLVDGGSLNPQDRFHLHFAIGKALESRGRFGDAFHHFEIGNALRRQSLSFDGEAISDEVRRTKATFTPELMKPANGEAAHPIPIFIVGMPRSGSTLVEQILASHSQIEGTAELPYIPALIQRLIADHWRTPVSYPEFLGGVAPAQLRQLGADYLDAARLHLREKRPFFIDKLPNNWANIGFIHLILPHAKIIDVRRHPLACCLSNFNQHFTRGQGYSYSLTDLGRYYRDYVSLLDHFETVAPGRVHRLYLEKLIAEPEAEIGGLLDHIGLPFEESCLRFHENKRPVRTASAEQVRRPISADGQDLWRNYDPWLGPLKRALGPLIDAYPADSAQ